jgi:hypothetical protein
MIHTHIMYIGGYNMICMYIMVKKKIKVALGVTQLLRHLCKGLSSISSMLPHQKILKTKIYCQKVTKGTNS